MDMVAPRSIGDGDSVTLGLHSVQQHLRLRLPLRASCFDAVLGYRCKGLLLLRGLLVLLAAGFLSVGNVQEMCQCVCVCVFVVLMGV